MKTVCPWIRVLLAIAALATLALIAAAALLGSTLPWPNATFTADGQTLAIGGVAGWHVALALIGVALAVLIGLVVVVLAVAFGLGVAALAVAAVVIAALAALAFVLSPLLVLGWLLWRLVRPRPAAGVSA
ncbi:MAG TPA: hypothetical protein VFF72_02340 [Caldimonas sp.]|nr:hypothetical protein [Caldimonas sp.]